MASIVAFFFVEDLLDFTALPKVEADLLDFCKWCCERRPEGACKFKDLEEDKLYKR